MEKHTNTSATAYSMRIIFSRKLLDNHDRLGSKISLEPKPAAPCGCLITTDAIAHSGSSIGRVFGCAPESRLPQPSPLQQSATGTSPVSTPRSWILVLVR